MRRLTVLVSLLALLPACTQPAPPPPATGPTPQRSYPPVDFGGQRVLILPLQAAEGLPGTRDQATAALVQALRDRDDRTVWVTPQQLRSSLRRAPGYAQDPGTLPTDTYRHHGDSFIQEPLAGIVRRYSALMDVRPVLIPRAARWIPWTEQAGGRVRFAAAVVDSRTGIVIWMGEADGAAGAESSPEAVTSAAAALAERMVIATR